MEYDEVPGLKVGVSTNIPVDYFKSWLTGLNKTFICVCGHKFTVHILLFERLIIHKNKHGAWQKYSVCMIRK